MEEGGLEPEVAVKIAQTPIEYRARSGGNNAWFRVEKNAEGVIEKYIIYWGSSYVLEALHWKMMQYPEIGKPIELDADLYQEVLKTFSHELGHAEHREQRTWKNYVHPAVPRWLEQHALEGAYICGMAGAVDMLCRFGSVALQAVEQGLHVLSNTSPS